MFHQALMRCCDEIDCCSDKGIFECYQGGREELKTVSVNTCLPNHEFFITIILHFDILQIMPSFALSNDVKFHFQYQTN